MSVRETHNDVAQGDAPELLARLRAASETERLAILCAHIRQELIATLGPRAPASVGLEQPFRDLGLTSMMTVQLWARLGDSLGTILSPALAFQFPTISSLAEHLLQILDAPRELPTRASEQQQATRGDSPQVERIRAELRKHLAEVLHLPPSDIRDDLRQLGLDALATAELCGRLESSLGIPLAPALFEQHTRLDDLARSLSVSVRIAPSPKEGASVAEPVAVIGLGCRFPGAAGPETFWRLLQAGFDAVGEVPAGRWDVEAICDPRPNTRGKVITRRGGFLSQVDQFDAAFFGIAPREAAAMDPQQRLLLEVTWEALEHAAIPPLSLSGAQAGVFVGISYHDYYELQRKADPSGEQLDLYAAAGNTNAVAAGRLAYFLGTRGPAYAIDTACSSSLVAAHLACKSLRDSEIDLAIVGGVNLILSPETSISFSQAAMLAPDGRCKTFDASANGYVRSEGCGVVVFKRLRDALRDGDRVLAVIRSSSTNQDGRSNGLTAPSGTAQEAVIRAALQQASVEPQQIGYVEVHGTGTPLGDPVEVQALGQVLRCEQDPSSRSVLGAVKTNIGHVEAAAGMAGLIKTCLALEHETIPGNLHLQEVNPLIPIEDLPFELPTERRPWSAKVAPRRAAISSFGFSGTNAHMVVEPPPPTGESAGGADRPLQLLALSARSPEALRELARRYLLHLGRHPGASWADICHTSLLGRSHLEHRLALVASSSVEARARLQAFAKGQPESGLWVGRCPEPPRGRLAFVFDDVGPDHLATLRPLYRSLPNFAEAVDRCLAALDADSGRRLRDALHADGREPLAEELEDVATFAVQYALACVWHAWGVSPHAVMGHGVGEYTAACIAGVFPVEAGIRLLAARRAGTPAEDVQGITFAAPRVAFVSSLSGRLVDKDGEQLSAAHWRRQASESGQLASGLESLRQLGCTHFVELGLGKTLAALGRNKFASLASTPSQSEGGSESESQPVTWLSFDASEGGWEQLLGSVARYWLQGGEIDWRGFEAPYPRRKVALPTYPFEHQRYWLESRASSTSSTPTQVASYEIAWRRLELVREQKKSALAARWLLVADEGGIAEQLAVALEQAGAQCRLLRSPSAVDDSSWADDATHPVRVVFLRGLDACEEPAGPQDLLQMQERVCGAALGLCQALLRRDAEARLWLITERAQSVTDVGGQSIQAAALWGLGRVVAREQLELFGGLVDLDGRSSSQVRALAELLLAEGAGEEEYALRQDTWYTPRLGKRSVEAAAPLTLDAAGTQLVTGGTGGLGRELCHWLVARGARRLLLLSRRATETPWMAELRAAGAEVSIAACDVGDAEQLALALQAARERGARFTGVFHCAGIDDPALVEEQSWERFVRMMTSKVLGGWNLHVLTQQDTLQHFVCYSSVAAIAPFVGQSGYAAANAFLDGLAAYRRQLGLPAVAINWGPWSEVGMAAHLDAAKSSWSRSGPRLRSVSVHDNLEQLASLLQSNHAQVAVLSIDLGDGLFAPGLPALLGELLRRVPPAQSSAAQVSSELASELATISGPSRFARLRTYVAREVAAVLGAGSEDTIPARKPLMDLGMDSLMAVELRHRLRALVGTPLPATIMFDQPTVEALTSYLLDKMALAAAPTAAKVVARQSSFDEPIAIVGMACRFPGGANNLDSYWRLLRSGEDGVGEVPRERWDIDAFYDPSPDAQGKMNTRRGGFLRGFSIADFDSEFFGISPREAKAMDPQQRLLLEVAWEALEEAGIPAWGLSGSRTGVFIGISTHDYEERLGTKITPFTGSGNLHSAAPGRLSYMFGLQGPSMVVDTGCSSVISAMHMSCQSLRSGDSDLALVGGVNIMLSPTLTVFFTMGRLTAPDGRCKTFDAGADGYVRSEGCGMLVLKRFSEAQRDGDRIWAIVRATAVNQDGRSASLTAPNGPAQERLMRTALEKAQLEASDIAYVEAHGAGTQLGDAIEAGALGATLGRAERGARGLAVGAVKTNVGHLEAASGVAGIIKVVLSLWNEELPPHRNLTAVNPKVPFDDAALVIPTRTVPWPRQDKPRFAGVSGFAFQGSNAHAILQEAPLQKSAGVESTAFEPYPLALSARSDKALRELCRLYAELVRARPHVDLADLCFSANVRRTSFKERAALVASNTDELLARLDALARGEVVQGSWRSDTESKGGVALVFSGGELRSGAGQELYRTQPHFKAALDECARGFERELPQPLLRVMFDDATGMLAQPPYARAAQFALHYALFRLWCALGVEPAAVLGVGTGEYAAACAAGVLRLEDAIRLVVAKDKESVAAQIAYEAPKLPWASAATGTLWPADAQPDAKYWSQEGRETATRLREAEEVLFNSGCRTFLSVGSNADLEHADTPAVFAATRLPLRSQHKSEQSQLLETLAVLYARGVTVSWQEVLCRPAHRKILLPAYPYERLRHWLGDTVEKRPVPTPAVSKRPAPSTPTLVGRPALKTPAVEQRPSASTSAAKLYEIQWRTPPAPVLQPRGMDGFWLVLGSQNGLAGQLAKTLRAAGYSRLAISDALPDWYDQPAVDTWWQETVPAGTSVQGVVHLLALDSDWNVAATEVQKNVTQLVGSAGALIRQLVKSGGRLWLVTSGAARVGGEEAPVAISQASAFGIGRTIAQEHPDLWGGLVDLDPDVPQQDGGGQLGSLFAELARGPSGDEVALRASGRYVARLAAMRDPAPAEGITELLRPDGWYLVTGGSSGLGLETAKWLASKGARHLALVSRSGVKDEAAPVVEALRAGGTEVVTGAVDVASQAALVSFVQKLGGPLRGIIHAAGVVRDKLLMSQQADDVDAVLKPKVLAARGLEALVEAQPLDFIVLYSSLSAWLGGVGQANYAAANAVLDGFAQELRRRGRRCVSIAWGPWLGVGTAARLSEAQQRHWKSQGIRLMDPEVALDGLARAMLGSAPLLSAANMAWADYDRARKGSLRFIAEVVADAHLEQRPVAKAPAAVAPARPAAPVSPPRGDSAKTVEAFIRSQLADIMELEDGGARLDGQRPLNELGLESLMALELRNRLQDHFQLELPVTMLWEHRSIDAVTRFLRSKLPSGAPAAALAPAEAGGVESGSIEAFIRSQLADIMELEDGGARLDSQRPLNELGLESLMALELRNRLQDHFQLELPVTMLWEHRSIDAVTRFLSSKLPSGAPAAALAPAGAGSVESGSIEAFIRSQLADIMELEDGGARLDGERPLNELGLESLMALELRNRLQDHFDLELPVTMLWEHRSIDAVTRFLSSKLPSGAPAAALAPTEAAAVQPATSPMSDYLRHILGNVGDTGSASLLLPLRSQGGRPPLYCIHSATGEAVSYGPLLSDGLGPDQPIYGIQSRGFIDPAYRPDSIAAMAREYARLINEHQVSGPLHLLGHSAGGFFAFVTAQELERLGRTVAFVGISDARRLSDYSQNAVEQRVAILVSTARLVGLTLKAEEQEEIVSAGAEMPEEEYARYCYDRVKPRALRFVQGREQEWDQWAALVRRLAHLNNGFVPEGKVAAQIGIWFAREEPQAQIDWRSHTTASVYVETINGNHITMLQGDNLRALQRTLKTRLMAATPALPSLAL